MKILINFIFLVFTWLLVATGSVEAQTQIKLTTTQTGIYRVTTNQLANALGLSPLAVSNLIATGNFTLLNQGKTNGWLAGANNSQLVFYAQSYINNYTTNNVYWLVTGTNLPLALVNGSNPNAQTNEYYLCNSSFEVDSTNYSRYDLANNPDNNYWYWAQVSGGGRFAIPFSYTNTTAFNAFGPTNIPSQLNVRVRAVTTTNQSVNLTVNGQANVAWTNNWVDLDGNDPNGTATNFTFTIPTTVLQMWSSNVFKFANNSAASSSVWLLDGFTVQYPRLYVATNGSLLCSANSNTVVTLQGFTNGNITVLDVTQPQVPQVVTNLNVESVSGAWQASLVPAQQNANYAACQLGSELDVAKLEAITPVGLASGTNRSVFVIIAPTNLLAATQPLADYRNAQGLETKVVSLESVYNEFDNGLREPKAISNFLAYAWQNWQVHPAYALLVGKGTYDYRNLYGAGDNLMPPLMIFAPLSGLVPSDSQYGQVTNAPGPQIAVGRFPVTNAVQVTNLIVKLKAYETNTPQARKALLLADFSDSAGDFQMDMGTVQTALTPSFSATAILPSNTASNAATMTTALLTDLNAGTDLFDYLGHGATIALGNSLYLTNGEVPLLTSTRLPLMVAITCYCGKFNIPASQCLSEAMVLSTNNGAIATLSASGASLNPEATLMNLALMADLVSGLPGRLGDYIRLAMVTYNQSSRTTPSGMYNILGDPTLQLDFTGVSLGGTVFSDTNRLTDGTVNGTGTFANGSLYANLLDNNNNVLASMAVLPSGLYSFSGVTNGNYTVQITTNAGTVGQAMPVSALPTGWIFTGEFVGNGVGNDGSPLDGLLAVTVNSVAVTNANFGITPLGSVGGQVVLDVNGNGLQDVGETTGIGGVTILLQTNGVTMATTNTDSGGNYTFGSLFMGNYTVVQTVPSGYLSTAPTTLSVSLGSGQNSTANNFFDARPVTIGDFTWLDINGNGIQDSGEPGLVGVTVVLSQSNTLTHAVTTVGTKTSGTGGYYLFTNLPPGIYQLGFTSPPAGGYTGTLTLQGSSTNLDSDANATSGLTAFITMLSGTTNLTLDAGFKPSPTAVSLVNLSAAVVQGQAWVTWQTYTETGLLAFDLTRSTASGTEQDVTPSLVWATGLDMGQQYTVPDAGAKLPGAYTYRLYGYYNDGAIEELATVNVSLANTASVTGPRILGLQITGTNAVLRWSGGLPPYVVEQSASLGLSANWQAVTSSQTATNCTIPLTNRTGFLRVRGASN